jgi:hypothetical protein
MRLWVSNTWGLLNFCWGNNDKWGIHLIVIDRDNWYWGCFDQEYDRVMTYWGLGPLGFISRTNF